MQQNRPGPAPSQRPRHGQLRRDASASDTRFGGSPMARIAPGLLVLVLAACQPAAATLDPSAEPIARQFFDEVRTGADLDASPHLAHELKNPTTEAEVAQFRSVIPE